MKLKPFATASATLPTSSTWSPNTSNSLGGAAIFWVSARFTKRRPLPSTSTPNANSTTASAVVPVAMSSSFIQEIDRVTFVEAVKFLAERTGIALPERSGPSREETEAADELYRANDLAQKYFHHLLLNDEVGASARTYLQTRGLTGETIERFGLGYAPPEWDALLKVAGRRGLNSPDIGAGRVGSAALHRQRPLRPLPRPDRLSHCQSLRSGLLPLVPAPSSPTKSLNT